MDKAKKQKKLKGIIKWILWVLLVQFIFINISGIFYGYKLTYFYEPSSKSQPPVSSRNVFTKTWKLFTGPRFQKSTLEDIPHLPYETVHLVTKNHLSLEGWYVPADTAKGTVILIHGLGENKSMLLKEGYEFLYLGFNVLLLDLRAHGNSGGNVTTLGFFESEDVKLAYEYILKRGERNIILYGISLGATVITKAIHDYDLSPSRVILELPFKTVEKLFAKRGKMLGFPQEPFGTLITFWASIERGFNGFDQNTSKFVQKIKCPVLLQYGALDKIVSFSDTESIFKDIASSNKKLVRYENAGHDFLLEKDPKKWRTEINEFLFK
ncbi:MAG TPA: alpha/beta hydrolase [Chitinophagaceae bacterium]|nr:alpha/beta hydrolase [Chitinophagaceae bacterium]